MSEANRQKVAIVTGSSRGIGYATSLLPLARNGFYTKKQTRTRGRIIYNTLFRLAFGYYCTLNLAT